MKSSSGLEWINASTINKILFVEIVIIVLVKGSLFLLGDKLMNDSFFRYTDTGQVIYITNQLTSF